MIGQDIDGAVMLAREEQRQKFTTDEAGGAGERGGARRCIGAGRHNQEGRLARFLSRSILRQTMLRC